MTSDIRSLIDDCTSASERREAEKRQGQKTLSRKTSVVYKRELSYIRGLGRSIRTIRLKLPWLKLIRAPGLKIEKLETKLKKRQAKLVFVTKALESGWNHAWRDQVLSNQTNRFYWLGVTAYRNDYNPTRMRSKASYFILRDNWGTRPTCGYCHPRHKRFL